MCIGQIISKLSTEVERCYEDLVSEKCYNNLKSMSPQILLATALKVSVIAFAVGITLGLICGSGIVGVLSAAICVAAALTYFTSDQQYKLMTNATRSINFNKISNEMADEFNSLNSTKK